MSIELCMKNLYMLGKEALCSISGRVLDLRLRGHSFETLWRHSVVSLSKTLYPLLNTCSAQEAGNRDLRLRGD